MSPTRLPPAPPPLGPTLIQIAVIHLYWRPLWMWIRFRARVETVFWTMLGRGPRRPGGNPRGLARAFFNPLKEGIS
jgi:hypothetical protein